MKSSVIQIPSRLLGPSLSAQTNQSRSTKKAEWDEDAHPRGANGRFGEGDGGDGSSNSQPEHVQFLTSHADSFREDGGTVEKLDLTDPEARSQRQERGIDAGEFKQQIADAREAGAPDRVIYGLRYMRDIAAFPNKTLLVARDSNGQVVAMISYNRDDRNITDVSLGSRQSVAGAASALQLEMAKDAANSGLGVISMVDTGAGAKDYHEKMGRTIESVRTLEGTRQLESRWTAAQCKEIADAQAVAAKAAKAEIEIHETDDVDPWWNTLAGQRLLSAEAAKAEWSEDDHPRDEHGRFGEGGSAHEPEAFQTLPGSQQTKAFKEAAAWTGNNCTGFVPSMVDAPILPAAVDGVSKGVTEDQAEALEHYSDEGYRGMNNSLRSDSETVDSDPVMRDVQAAIDANTVNENAVVFRGTTDANLTVQILSMAPGETFTDKGFVSTSLVRGVGEQFSGQRGMLFQMAVPKGSHAVGLVGGEGELLLGANSKFRLESVDTSDKIPVAKITYVGADPHMTGTFKKAQRGDVKDAGKFGWTADCITIERKSSKAKKAIPSVGIVWKSTDFGKERILWKSTVRTHTVKVRWIKKAKRINWSDHPDHVIHKEIVDYYVHKLAAAMQESIEGIDKTISDAKRRYELMTKAIGESAKSAAAAAIRANLRISQQQTRSILRNMIADSIIAASHSAAVQIGSGADMPTGLQGYASDIDWDKWKPGWAEAADLARDGGLQTLLEKVDVTIKYMDETSLDRIGTALANGLEAGTSVERMANDMLAVVSANMTGPDGAYDPNLLAPPDRAFLIAQTETSRAMAAATSDTYAANDIEQWEWLAQGSEDGDPDDRVCNICLERDGETYDIGGEDLLPPQHPRCRCVMLPVVIVPPLPETPDDTEAPDDSTEVDDLMADAEMEAEE